MLVFIVHCDIHIHPSDEFDDAISMLLDRNQMDDPLGSILQFETIFFTDIQTNDFLIRRKLSLYRCLE
jgi:hypothetical protein